jgi:hypothetical protein
VPGNVFVLVPEDFVIRHAVKEIPCLVELADMSQAKPLIILRAALLKYPYFRRPKFTGLVAIRMIALALEALRRGFIPRYFSTF